MEPSFTQSRDFPVRKRLHANPKRAMGVMLKVRQSYRAHSARGLWQAVSLLTERVSQADIPTMELVQATKQFSQQSNQVNFLSASQKKTSLSLLTIVSKIAPAK